MEWRLTTIQDEMMYALILEQRKTNELLQLLVNKQTVIKPVTVTKEATK